MTRENAPLAQPNDVQAYAGPAVEQMELSRVFDVVRRRFWLMLATLVVVLAAGVIYTIRQKPVYEATALMLVATTGPVAVNSNDVNVVSDVAALNKSRSTESQIELMTSPEILRDAATKLGEYDLSKGYGSQRLPQWALSVDSKKESDVISVTAKAYDPDVAANLANELVTTYISHDQAMSSQATKQGREYISTELSSVSKQLSDARKELSDYKRKSRLVAADDQLKAIASNAVSLQMEQDKASIDLASSRQEEETLSRQLAGQGDEIQQSSMIQLSPEYQEALNTLAKLYSQRATLIQEYQPDSKEIKKIDGTIAETLQMMSKATQTITASKVRTRNPAISSYMGSVVNRTAADARMKAIEAVIAKRNQQIDALPEQERSITKLMENVSVLERTYQTLSDKYYTLLVNEKSTLPAARFASTAYASPAPFAPNKKKNAVLFFLLGAMLSVCVAAVAERMDKKVRYEDVITRLTGEAPLAVIPNLKGPDKANLQLDSVDQGSAFVESFRVLRNIIDFSKTDEPLQIIAVTSPGQAEGKSVASINLAVAAALSGKRVLVVDCDLRRPSVSKKISSRRNFGFTNLVKGLVSIEDAVVATRIPNLYCLPAGPLPLNPSDFLNLPECRATFKTLRETFDWVVIDGPPCAGLSDMQVVSTIADGVLLVVSMNQTRTDSLNWSIRLLSQVGAPYIGSVINKQDANCGGYCSYREIEIENVEMDTEALVVTED